MIQIFLMITVLLFTACGTAEVKPKVVKEDKIPKVEVLKKDPRPLWIDNPNMDAYTGEVGIVKLMKNKKKQKYIAKKIAIAALQNQKRVEIKSEVNIKESYDSATGKTISGATHEIHQASNHFKTQDLIVKDEYSNDEYYYIWVVVKK